MLLACVQTDVEFAQPAANASTVLETIDRLGDAGVDLAVFPECMLTGYGFDSRSEAMGVAITPQDAIIGHIAGAAGRSSMTVVLGTLLKTGDRLHNSSLMIDGSGIIGRYDKIHLPHLGVDRFVDRGSLPYSAFPTANGCRVGLAICYDSSFPEPMRELGLAGADVIALSTNWPVAAFRTAEIVPPARSMENHLFFISANRCGVERGFDYCGLSAICGPDGVELARAPDDQPIVLKAEIDVADARNKRIERTTGKHVIDRFADRRPEFYRRLVDPVVPPEETGTSGAPGG